MTNLFRYGGNQGDNTVNEGSNFSPFLWRDCPIMEIKSGLREGWIFEDDFTGFIPVAAAAEANYAPYKGFASTGGSVTAYDEIGGVVSFGSDDDNEGASIRTASLPFQISRSHGKLWFEARIKSSTITDTKHGFFVGLIDSATLSATVPIAADGTLADENFVGFHRLEGDGDQLDTVYKADGVTQVSVQTDSLHTALVADTYTKVGFIYNDSDYVLTFYQDGKALTTTKTIPSAAGTDFPNDVRLGLVFAVLNATGTAPGTAQLDKWRCVQLAAG